MCPKHSFEDLALLVQVLLSIRPGKVKSFLEMLPVHVLLSHTDSSSVVSS